jgi:hypothetical protein
MNNQPIKRMHYEKDFYDFPPFVTNFALFCTGAYRMGETMAGTQKSFR